MVIPWIGIPMADFLKRVEPTGSAKYVAFQTLLDPEHRVYDRRLKWRGFFLVVGPATEKSTRKRPMLIKVRKPSDVLSSEITPRSVYIDRRRFLRTAAVAGAGAAL